jgi:hypothetical protein
MFLGHPASILRIFPDGDEDRNRNRDSPRDNRYLFEPVANAPTCTLPPGLAVRLTGISGRNDLTASLEKSR